MEIVTQEKTHMKLLIKTLKTFLSCRLVLWAHGSQTQKAFLFFSFLNCKLDDKEPLSTVHQASLEFPDTPIKKASYPHTPEKTTELPETL